MDLWGDTGPFPRWAFRVDSTVGSKHNIVCDILSVDGATGHALVSLYPCRTKARIMTGVPSISTDVVSVAILGAEYVDGVGMPGFKVSDPRMVLTHPRIGI